jgi:hypothetical protein
MEILLGFFVAIDKYKTYIRESMVTK